MRNGFLTQSCKLFTDRDYPQTFMGASQVRRGLAVVLAMLGTQLSGCIYMQSYPDKWSPREVSAGSSCPDISGNFANAGYAGESGGAKVPTKLAYFVLDPGFTGDTDAIVAADQVELRAEGDEIAVVVRDGARDLYTRTIRRPMTCDKGEIKLADPQSPGATSTEGVVGVLNSTLYLSRAEDGSLLIRRAVAGAGVGVFIPFVAAGWDWSRFPVFESAGAGEPRLE